MRRWFLPILILAITAFSAWQLFQRLGIDRSVADPWWAVPPDAAVIIEVPRPLITWDEAGHGSVIFNTLLQGTGHAMVDTVMRQLALVGEAAPEGPLLIALVRLGAGRIATAMAFAGGDPRSFSALIAALGISEADARIASHGTPIAIRPSGTDPVFQLVLANGLVLIGDDPGVLGTMAGQARGEQEPAWPPGMLLARSSWGSGVDAHVVLRTDPAWRMLGTWTSTPFIDRDPWPDGWVAFDLRVRADALLMSGMLLPDSGTQAGVAGPGHDPVMMLRHLPPATGHFEIHDPARSRAGLEHTIPEDLRSSLLDWMNGPVIAISGGGEEGAPWRALIAVEVDSTQLVESLGPLLAEGDVPTNHRGIPMLRIPALAHLTVGGREPADPWCAWQEGRLVIGHDAAAVRLVLDAWIDGMSLASNARAAQLFQRIATRAQYTFWWDPQAGRAVLRADLSAQGRALLDDQVTWLDRMGGVVFQSRTGADGRHYLSAGLLQAPAVAGSDDGLWRTKLHAPLARQPDVVRNHINGLYELLVQDTTHHIALVSGAGQVLWERPLDGPILGSVRQVDRFKNRKLQLLICTARTLYLIDRNGKDVEGFPLSLPAGAVAAASVFDYERDGNYRVMVPLADGRILNLTPDGKAVQGFEPPGGMAPAAFPVTHLRFKGKDHLVMVCSDGRIHVLDRKGQVRYQPRLELGTDARPLLLVPGADIGSTQLLWATADGAIQRASLDGEPVRIGRAAAGQVAVVGRGDRQAILLARGDTLELLGADGIQWALPIPTPVATVADAGSSSGHALLLWLDGQGQAHVLNHVGSDLWHEREPAVVPGILADLQGDGATEWIFGTKGGELVAIHRGTHHEAARAANR